MDYRKAFPKRLTQVRKEAGKTQDEMAILMDISRPSYTMYETGASYPKFENLMIIADILNISIDYLVGLSDVKNRKK